MWAVLSIFNVMIELASLSNLATAFLKKKPRQKFMWVGTLAYLVLTTAAVGSGTLENQGLKFVVVLCIYCVFTQLFYDGSKLTKLGIAIISMAIVYYIDYIIIVFVKQFLHLDLWEIMSSIGMFLLISIVSKFTLYIVTFVVKIFKKETRTQSKISLYDWTRVLLFPAFSLVTMGILMEAGLKNLANLNVILFDATGLVLANVIILSFINNLEEKNRIQQQNVLLEQRITLKNENMKVLRESYEKQRKMTHDFSNHLDAIDALLKAENSQVVGDYLLNLHNSVVAGGGMISSNNIVVDALVNEKYNKAVEKNITMEFMINDLSAIKISPENIVIILGNALDNAIEAVAHCQEKVIKVKIFQEAQSSTLSIKNTVMKKVEIVENEICTSKCDAISHGYGIKNIKNAVGVYGGTLSLGCDDEWFSLTVVIA